MTKQAPIIAEFICTKDHWPHIFTPWEPKGMPNSRPMFSIIVPAEPFAGFGFAPRDRKNIGMSINASSQHRPMVMAGDGGWPDATKWETLMREAAQWQYPYGHLLDGRPVQVAAIPWQQRYDHPFQPSMWVLSLQAVQIGGDLDKDEGLEAHIAERKKWFNR